MFSASGPAVKNNKEQIYNHQAEQGWAGAVQVSFCLPVERSGVKEILLLMLWVPSPSDSQSWEPEAYKKHLLVNTAVNLKLLEDEWSIRFAAGMLCIELNYRAFILKICELGSECSGALIPQAKLTAHHKWECLEMALHWHKCNWIWWFDNVSVAGSTWADSSLRLKVSSRLWKKQSANSGYMSNTSSRSSLWMVLRSQ